MKKPYFAGTGDDLWAAGDLAGEVVGVTEATFEEFETKAGEDQAWSQNSILFCLLSTINDQCGKVHYQQTHNQGVRQFF